MYLEGQMLANIGIDFVVFANARGHRQLGRRDITIGTMRTPDVCTRDAVEVADTSTRIATLRCEAEDKVVIVQNLWKIVDVREVVKSQRVTAVLKINVDVCWRRRCRYWRSSSNLV